MEGGMVYGGSSTTVILQNDRLPCSSEVLDSLWISNSSPPLQGDSRSCSMVHFEDVRGDNPTDMPFFPPLEKEENGNEDYDDCFHQPEKKRRLTVDQVWSLERNFEVENKLEPERKVQLAKELGLQPRQVAIWFQNRRARFKTKQLEKDYNSLKESYDMLKSDYESLHKENERLRNQVNLLTDKLLLRGKGNTNSEPTHDPINPMVAEPQKQIPIENSENKSKVPMVFCKQEEASSAKSDVSDSDSPPHFFGAEQSDFSQDDEDDLTRSFLPPPWFPKLEDGCHNERLANFCNWSSPVEGGQPSWLWRY